MATTLLMKSVVKDGGKPHAVTCRPSKIFWLQYEHLLQIVEYACLDDKTGAAHIRLSGVCRRFRSIVIHHTAFWTYLSPAQSGKLRNLQVERSRGEGLVIDFSLHGKSKGNDTRKLGRACVVDGTETHAGEKPMDASERSEQHEHTCTCSQFLQFARKHSERWTEITFTVNHANTPQREQVIQLLKNLTLPSLRRLTLDPRASANHDATVCLNWGMPVLQNLTCNQHFAAIVTRLSSPLITLNFTIAQERGFVNPKILVDVLGSPALAKAEELLLDFEGDIRGYPGGKSMATMLSSYIRDEEPLGLPCVGHLSLKFDHAVVEDAVECVLDRLRLPQLEHLSVEMGLSIGGASTSLDAPENYQPILHCYVPLLEWLTGPLYYAEFHPHPRDLFPSLQSVRFIVSGYDPTVEKALKEELDVWINGGMWTPKGEERDVLGMKDVLEVNVQLVMQPVSTS